MIGLQEPEPLAKRQKDAENSDQDEMKDDGSQKQLRPHMVPMECITQVSLDLKVQALTLG